MLTRRVVRILRKLGVRRVSRKMRGASGAYRTYTLVKLAAIVGASCLAGYMADTEITVVDPRLGRVVHWVFHLAGPMGILGAAVTVAIGYFVLKLRVRAILIAIALGLVLGGVLVQAARVFLK